MTEQHTNADLGASAAGQGVSPHSPAVFERLEEVVRDQTGQLLEMLAEHVRSTSPRTLMQDAEQLARRRPALALGGAFLLGAIASEWLRQLSSDEQTSRAPRPSAERASQERPSAISGGSDLSGQPSAPGGSFPHPNRVAAVARDIPDPDWRDDATGAGSPIGSGANAGGATR